MVFSDCNMKTILVVFALIQVSVTLECVNAVKDSTQLDGSERSNTCLCGDYCVSYYYQEKQKYAWSCGCLLDPGSVSELDSCTHDGMNHFGGVFYGHQIYCCSGDLCNNKNLSSIGKPQENLRSFVKAHLVK